MIAKSDLVILTLSTAALAVGIVRWQHGTTVVPSVTVPASARQAAPVPRPAPEPAVAASPRVVELPARTDAEAAPVPDAPVVSRLPAAGAEPPAPEALRVPDAGAPEADVAALAPAPEPEPRYGVHRVRPGDYLGRIAQRYGTSVATLRELNGIRGSTIRVDQRIRYPLPAP